MLDIYDGPESVGVLVANGVFVHVSDCKWHLLRIDLFSFTCDIPSLSHCSVQLVTVFDCTHYTMAVLFFCCVLT